MFDKKLIDEYKSFLTNVRYASANTIASYMHDIRKFADFLESENKTNFFDIDPELIRAFTSFLSKSGKSPATVSRSLVSLKSLFRYLIELGYYTTNPVSDVVVTKNVKAIPRILSSKDIRLLLTQPNTSDLKGCRDKAMLEVLYATGIRVTELINLDLSDINLTTGLISCRNGKVRIIPIHNAAVKAVERYLSLSRPQMIVNGEKALFVNTDGERMSRQGFWKILKVYSEQAGIKEDITPQTLRNSFAAHMLENGANIHTLKEILGHAGLSTTQAYARIVKYQLKDDYNKAHPIA